jgi:DNA-binding GntR family transcriptional regulator
MQDESRAWRGTTPEDRIVGLPPALPDTGEEIYLRVAQVLREAYATGALRRNERLPMQGPIARRYGCSKPTVARAVAHLVGLGLMRKLPDGRVFWLPGG